MTSVPKRGARAGFARSALRPLSTLTIVGLAMLSACGGTTETPPAKDVVPATITATSTDVRGGVAGGDASSALTVVVLNKAGEPLDTAVVTFAVASGGGTVASSSVRTNAAGEATTTWTLGPTAGAQTVTATAGTLAPVTFQAIATVGPVAKLTKVAGDAQTAQINTNVAVAPSVKLTDAFDNPVAGVLVGFTIGSGAGLVNGGAANTNAEGIATVSSWRLGAAVGANTLVATAGSLTVTFTATGAVGAPAAVTLTPVGPASLTIGQTLQLTATVKDAAGNVIAHPTVGYSTSAASVASVTTPGGLITAVGAGTATITATSGTATATVPVTIIGHPAGTLQPDSLSLGAVPGDVAFTNTQMLAAINGLLQVAIYDQTGTTKTSTIQLTTGVPILLAPTRAAGPAVAINVGTTSRLWFIDPLTSTILDSVDVDDAIQSANMTSDGSRIFVRLSNGQMMVFDGATHARLTTLTLGGGITQTKIAGDTLLYALTSVGVIFEIDTRTFATRQIIGSAGSTDFAIGKDGLFYLLDGTASLVRLFNITTGTVVRTVGVSAFATTIALSPDGQQIWLTHSNPAQVTIYTGNATNGFLSTGSFSTNNSAPMRIYFSPSGSFAAVTNIGGWIDIVR